MAGRSIRTLVDSGHPPRHQLDLHPADGSVIGREIAHLHTGQVLRLIHFHETVRFRRHQAQRAPNIRAWRANRGMSSPSASSRPIHDTHAPPGFAFSGGYVTAPRLRRRQFPQWQAGSTGKCTMDGVELRHEISTYSLPTTRSRGNRHTFLHQPGGVGHHPWITSTIFSGKSTKAVMLARHTIRRQGIFTLPAQRAALHNAHFGDDGDAGIRGQPGSGGRQPFPHAAMRLCQVIADCKPRIVVIQIGHAHTFAVYRPMTRETMRPVNGAYHRAEPKDRL